MTMNNGYHVPSSDLSFLSKFGLSAEEKHSGIYCGEWLSSPFGVGGVSTLVSKNPATGKEIGQVLTATKLEDGYEKCMEKMQKATETWSNIPAPKRGEIVRQIGDELRKVKNPLGRLVALEMGKIEAEGVGEVQEFIDICDLAVGLSRQLEGKVFPSERSGHFLMECWNPLGTMGVITAFNFPIAVLGWNAALGLVCGNCILWKPSESVPFVSVAVMKIIANVLERNPEVPPGVFCLCMGDLEYTVGQMMAKDVRLKLMSFTGSTAVGREVGQVVQKRFGKLLLELGGNNASIIMDDADIDIAVKGSVFSAVREKKSRSELISLRGGCRFAVGALV